VATKDGPQPQPPQPQPRELRHECRYVGEHANPPIAINFEPASPSGEYAKLVALSVLDGRIGMYHSIPHFRKRMAERKFDVLDVMYAIRNGKCVRGGKFFNEFRNHRYTFRACIDASEFDAVFALSADHDFIESPLLVLITGCFKTSTGKKN